MGLCPFGASSPLFFKNEQILGFSPIHRTLIALLGFTGYYRRFIKDYAKLVKLLSLAVNALLIGLVAKWLLMGIK